MPQFSDDLFLGTAVAYQGTDAYPNSATFTGSIATTTNGIEIVIFQSQTKVVGPNFNKGSQDNCEKNNIIKIQKILRLETFVSLESQPILN
jgi:hypothetical protein